MTEQTYIRSQVLYKRIKELKIFLEDLHSKSTFYIKSFNREIRVQDEELSKSILQMLETELRTLEDEFQQL